MKNKYPVVKEYRQNNATYVLIQTPYGICKQRKDGYLRNHDVGIQAALNKTEYYINQYLERYQNNTYDLSLIKYSHGRAKIIIKDFYGICRIRPDLFLLGIHTSIKNAINKTEYFINQARKVHGDKYDYSKVKYIDGKSKVIIISEYGEFLQTPNSHLAGDGCPITSIVELSHLRGWSLSSWQKLAKNSKNFTGYKLYLIECWDEQSEEKFYKIGITFTNISERFKYSYHLPYKYKIIDVIISDDATKIFKLEVYYKKLYKSYKYLPIKHFAGKYECFKIKFDIKENYEE